MIHDREYWLDDSPDGHHFDATLACAIAEFSHGSLLDLGCGRGDYVRRLRELGFEIMGVDGNPHTPDWCLRADLCEPQAFGRFDIVLSLEVGEHIPREFESRFLQNVCRHAERWVILSWAVPGQGGRGHVNERDNEHVAMSMRALGFEQCPWLTTCFREQSSLAWFKNTLSVYKRVISQPEICVITTTRDRCKLLYHTVASFRRQVGVDAEMVVVSDGGRYRDDKDVCDEFRVQHLVHEGGNYGAAGKDLAISESSADYVCFWDDDNIYEPHALATLRAVAAGVDVGVAQVWHRGNRTFIPRSWDGTFRYGDVDTACFCVRTEVARRVRWMDSKGADYDWIQAIHGTGASVRFEPVQIAFHV